MSNEGGYSLEVPKKDVFTTTEVARVFRVSTRTVSKWFDSGELRGWRIPGGKDRRIPRKDLIDFMVKNGVQVKQRDRSRRETEVIARFVPRNEGNCLEYNGVRWVPEVSR